MAQHNTEELFIVSIITLVMLHFINILHLLHISYSQTPYIQS